MTAVATAIVGAAVVGGVASNSAANKAAGAAGSAANTQQIAAWEAEVRQQNNLDYVRNLLQPYVDSGTSALGGQRDLLGLNGGGAQQSAYDSVSNSPGFNSVVQQGENAILQNASATGGLRGGNTQAALAQYRPSMLQSAIDQQYQRLGGLVNVGQNAAAGVGNTGSATANQISGLITGAGAANAGAALAQGRASGQAINGVTSAFGTGLSSLSGLNQYSASPYNTSGNNGVTGTDDLTTMLNLNNNYGTSGGVKF